MRTIILKTIIYLTGFLCLYGMIAIRYQPLYNLVLKEKTIPDYWDDNKYGELYYFNNISYFREDIPPVLPKFQFSPMHASLEDAEILTFGDSFMDFSRHEQLSSRLHDSLDLPVFYEYNHNPVRFLKENNYQNTRPKYLVYTRTERWIMIDFLQKPVTDYIHIDPEAQIGDGNPSAISVLNSYLTRLKNLLFVDRTDELLKAMLQRSYLTSKLNTYISTARFDLFGYVSSYTPKYSLEHETPWLFFIDQLNDDITSFYYPHTDEEIRTVADNIKKMSDFLWDEYRLKLIFMPVPAKYTIYHFIVDPDAEYNNFLPRLYNNLSERNVRYVDLYTPYKKSDDFVFYGTDDHWTERGVSIAANEVLEKINDLSRF
jgi:hypothetical protein